MAIAPVIETLIKTDDEKISMFGYIIVIRAKPYPPSFRRMAASTIDPAIGASTCAFGNHRWVENRGSFTRNPITVINQNRQLSV